MFKWAWRKKGNSWNMMHFNRVSFQSTYVKALTPNVTVFGGRSLKEVIKAKWSHNGGTSIHTWRRDTRNVYVERKSHVRTQWEGSQLQLRREAREKPNLPTPNLRLPASGAMRKWISVVQATQWVIFCYYSLGWLKHPPTQSPLRSTVQQGFLTGLERVYLFSQHQGESRHQDAYSRQAHLAPHT